MSQELEQHLRKLEIEAERAGPGAGTHLLSRAGDLCLGAGDHDRALAYYGRAIDASLHARRYNAAAGMCRKLLRVAPSAVRTRCTLAWLAIGRGDADEASREVGAYLQAAITDSQQRLAGAHLAMMADISRVPGIRRMIAGHLAMLGDHDAADAIRNTIIDDDAPPPLTAQEQEHLWRAVVESAMLGPQDLPS